MRKTIKANEIILNGGLATSGKNDITFIFKGEKIDGLTVTGTLECIYDGYSDTHHCFDYEIGSCKHNRVRQYLVEMAKLGAQWPLTEAIKDHCKTYNHKF